MKLFECPGCRLPADFEDRACGRCGLPLGFSPAAQDLVAVGPQVEVCANRPAGVCNWLLPAGSAGSLCLACAHNRLIPDLGQPGNLARWRKLERAKHRLFYSLRRLGLPTDGLVFDCVAGATTGHANGVITVDIAEADDAERERTRALMGEPYRTLLGHFRHEIGHYYWDRLVRDGGPIARFRALFGDERQPYGDALRRYYRDGPPPDWQSRHVSAYGASHPWEDFAETWAHYLHIVDTLETAAAHSMSIGEHPPGPDAGPDPYRTRSAAALLAAWRPLAAAVNGVNRSMGQPDLYPFALTAMVQPKLDFVVALATAPGASDLAA